MTRPSPVGHVAEHQLLKPTSSCPLCGVSGERKRSVLLQHDPEVWLRNCTTCGGASAERLPREEFLQALYDPAHYSSSLVSSGSLTQRCARRVARYLPKMENQAAVRILDYGGNDGSLARALASVLRARGIDPVQSTIVDLFPRADSADLRFQSVDAFLASSEHYDVVLASAVLEHLPNSFEVTRRLLAASAPGATLYFRAPYDEPLHRIRRSLGIRWPRHLHDFGPSFWDHFIRTFQTDLPAGATLLRSAPSIVETDLSQAPARTIAAHALKAPAHFEGRCVRPLLRYRTRVWRWVGGWEAIVRTGHAATTAAK